MSKSENIGRRNKRCTVVLELDVRMEINKRLSISSFWVVHNNFEAVVSIASVASVVLGNVRMEHRIVYVANCCEFLQLHD